MIFCVQIEKISACLSFFAPLMDQYQRGEVNFPDNALKWLEEAEKTMSSLRLSEGSEMSSLRGRILKAMDALRKGDAKPAHSTLRRARNVAAAEALDRAEAILRDRLLASEERLKFFEDKLCEGITAFVVQNPLPNSISPYQAWLLLVWNRLCQFQATRPLTLYLATSLSQPDRIFILNKVLSRIKISDFVSPETAD